MKRAAILFTLMLAAITVFASNTPKNTKVVVSNYNEVLKQIEYPEVCREQGIEGTVYVRIFVDSKGEMTKYDIVKSPCSDLESAVEKVLHKLDFQPATVEGQQVGSKILIPIEFRLTY